MMGEPEKPEHWDEVNALAGTIIAWHDAIKKFCEPLSDEKIRALAEIFEHDSEPGEKWFGGSNNFTMPIYAEMAQQLRAELGVRHIFRRWEELGRPDYYCVHCDGACKPEHLAELKES